MNSGPSLRRIGLVRSKMSLKSKARACQNDRRDLGFQMTRLGRDQQSRDIYWRCKRWRNCVSKFVWAVDALFRLWAPNCLTWCSPMWTNDRYILHELLVQQTRLPHQRVRVRSRRKRPFTKKLLPGNYSASRCCWLKHSAPGQVVFWFGINFIWPAYSTPAGLF